MTGPRFTASDLYGPSGRPQAADIDQDQLNDCYLVAPMSGLARQQPQRLQDAISYDEASRSFKVRMYRRDADGIAQPVTVDVSQADLRDNLRRHGGSAVDNLSGVDGPIWPAVMETAYAELQDRGSRSANYAAIEFGEPGPAMHAITGESGQDVTREQVAALTAEQIYTRLETALTEGRPVTLGAYAENPGFPQDGLQDRHMYAVEGVRKVGEDMFLDLRNPLAVNVAGEGNDPAGATVSVSLNTLKQSDATMFNIGPAPLPPTTPAAPEPTVPASDSSSAVRGAAPIASTGNRHVDALLANLNDPVALKQAMRELYDSPASQALREGARAQYQESLTREPAQAAPAPQAPAPEAPVRAMSR
ncbi:C2 family cysteine protease [Pseudomonas sp. CGJS7]|uniref:C2 family cysteine protease n=1 Tax=Pseudomonas sp. CGJS7 TaxID=3109348 RepID=UPI003009A0F6